jgi:pyruvate kinase
MAIKINIKLLRNRRTKIVATLGPSSDTPEMIEKLINAGVNVFRLNMSHGVHEKHRETYNHIRAITKRLDSPVAVLADLCGPKIRVGKFPDGGIDLTEGDTITVTTRDVEGSESLIPSQYRALAGDVVEGNRILLDDGNIELTVLAVDGSDISCRVCNDGHLKNHKGMNLPNSKLSTSALTAKDRADVRLAVEADVDFVALSFVRQARDVQQLSRYLKRLGSDIPIISKIEQTSNIIHYNHVAIHKDRPSIVIRQKRCEKTRKGKIS